MANDLAPTAPTTALPRDRDLVCVREGVTYQVHHGVGRWWAPSGRVSIVADGTTEKSWSACPTRTAAVHEFGRRVVHVDLGWESWLGLPDEPGRLCGEHDLRHFEARFTAPSDERR